MADPVVTLVVEKLFNLLVAQATLLQGVQEQVGRMQRELKRMETYLEVADAKQRTDKRVAQLVSEVRELAYDAEDAVDRYIRQMHLWQRHGIMGNIERYACLVRELHMSRHVSLQGETIKSRLQEIFESMTRLGVDPANAVGTAEITSIDKTVKEQRELALQRDMDIFVGYEEDRQIVKRMLLDKTIPRRSVISIVGMGGAGKTTLARRVCNSDDVKASFDCCALVSVSQAYTAGRIFEDVAYELFDSAALRRVKEAKPGGEVKKLREEVRKFLGSSKYLIVLDDVWETAAWSDIQPDLPDTGNGSRVMITTRSMNVAKFADPSTPPHTLNLLNEEQSWDLFTRVVFPGEDVEQACGSQLKDVGEAIVRRCGGLPLAVRVMGGLLSMKDRTPWAWQEVRDGIDWEEIPEGEVTLRVLALSYEALSSSQKPCFLYFSCFSEDFAIDAQKLIQLWIAEGFIPDEEKRQRTRGKTRTMEDIAEGWLEDLVQRCLVQGTMMSSSGRVLRCRIHDLLRELAVKKAEEVNFVHTCRDDNVRRASPPLTTRRLAIHGYSLRKLHSSPLKVNSPLPKVRTLLGNGTSISLSGSLHNVIRMQLLRVLDLVHVGIRDVPRAIGGLVNLRYLGLRDNNLRSIPSSIRKLQSLQTLDVLENGELERLPECVWEMSSLRHLFMPRMAQLAAGDADKRPAAGEHRLVGLQTLQFAIAGPWIHSSLATMTSLRRLVIVGVVRAHRSALAESLDSLVHLRSLTLEGDALPRKALALRDHHHLEELTLQGALREPGEISPPSYRSEELPPNLCSLEVLDSGLQEDPLPLLRMLPYLRYLKVGFHAYSGQELVFSAGGFPQLQQLELIQLWGIRRWRVEEGAMPRLSHLTMHSCVEMEDLPEGLRHLKALRNLHISGLAYHLVERLRGDAGQHIPVVQIPGW